MENPDLSTYLKNLGCEILTPISDSEVAHFLVHDRICIIYKDRNGKFAYNSQTASLIHRAYLKDEELDLRKRFCTSGDLKRRRKQQLINRDGLICFYSGIKVSEKELTLEHLTPLSIGGLNTLENLVLCTFKQNQLVRGMTLVEKIRYRDKQLEKKEPE